MDSNSLVKEPKSLIRRLLRIAVCLFLVFVAVLFFLPSIVGTRWIYQPLLNRLAADEFHLNVDSVKLSWFGSIKLNGLSITQADGSALVSVPQVRTDRGLVGYLLSGRKLGRLEIIKPIINIQIMNEGTNLQRLSKALESTWLSKSKGRRSSTPSLDFDISVRELSAQMRRAGQDLPMQVIPPFNLDVEYRASSGESYVDILPTRILHQVDLTPELMQLGLELAVPLLAHSARFDGQVSLSSEKIHVPLDAPLDANGSLTLVLHQVRSEPTHPAILQALDFVAGLRNREPSHEFVFVDGAQVEIELANQKVFHRGLQVGLPRVDPRLQITTTGSVGIADRTLDLIVGIPVPVEYLARREQVRELGVPNLHLVVLGTLDQPVVQWTSLRKESGALLSTIGSLLGSDSPGTSAFLSTLGNITEGQTDETIAAGVDVLKNFLESRRNRRQPADADVLPEGDPSANNEAKDEVKPASRPILDALRQRLRGRSN